MRRKKYPVKRRDDLVSHPRLKTSEIPKWREKLYDRQGGICPICGTGISKNSTVLDHCHSSGLVRGTLHRGCNALLGKIENNYRRVGVSLDMIGGISTSIFRYITCDYSENPFHPKHRTAEEKKLATAARAKAKRKANK